jgi:phage-related protein
VKPLHWVASSLEDLREFPEVVKDEIGHALWIAQEGGKYHHTEPMRGFGGAGVLEVLSRHVGDTYRAVYTVKFARAVYVLHCFMKKSKRGIATSKRDVDLIRARLRDAEEHYREHYL